MYDWRRPNNIEFPKRWLEFTIKDTESNDFVKYVVQDLPEDRYEEAVKIMTDIFLRDETICSAKSK